MSPALDPRVIGLVVGEFFLEHTQHYTTINVTGTVINVIYIITNIKKEQKRKICMEYVKITS